MIKPARLVVGDTFTKNWFDHYCLNRKDFNNSFFKIGPTDVPSYNAKYSFGPTDNSECFLVFDINDTIPESVTPSICVVTVTPSDADNTLTFYSKTAERFMTAEVDGTYKLEKGEYVIIESKDHTYYDDVKTLTIDAAKVTTGTATVTMDAPVIRKADISIATFSNQNAIFAVTIAADATPVTPDAESGLYRLSYGVKYDISYSMSGYTTKTVSDYELSVDMISSDEIEEHAILVSDLVQGLCTVTMSDTPNDSIITITRWNGKVISAEEDGTYKLLAGDYSYVAKKADYDDLTGTFTVSASDVDAGTKTVTLTLIVDTAIVTLTPSVEATIVVKNASAQTVTAEADGTYKLVAGNYTYDASASGYATQTGVAFTVTEADEDNGKTVAITMVPADCVVTFTKTPEDLTLEVKDSESTVVEAEVDGTYKLQFGTYSYTASKDTYNTQTDVELVISKEDADTGTKTVVVTLVAA